MKKQYIKVLTILVILGLVMTGCVSPDKDAVIGTNFPEWGEASGVTPPESGGFGGGPGGGVNLSLFAGEWYDEAGEKTRIIGSNPFVIQYYNDIAKDWLPMGTFNILSGNTFIATIIGDGTYAGNFYFYNNNNNVAFIIFMEDPMVFSRNKPDFVPPSFEP